MTIKTMTTTPATEAPAALLDVINGACDRIAPTWPLDRFIAVNPYWGWRQSSIAETAARLGALAGTALTMPRSWFREEWTAGNLAAHHIEAAASALGDSSLGVAARAALEVSVESNSPLVRRMALMSDVLDSFPGPGPVAGRTWTDLIAHQIGQHCAAHFDMFQATWGPDDAQGLFEAWRAAPSVTHGFRWRRGSTWARERLDSLPESSIGVIATVLCDLGIPDAGAEAYLTAVLTSVNGWAAWCAYRRWQARLADGDDSTIVDLAAIAVVWEWLLAADFADNSETQACVASWAASWTCVDEAVDINRETQRIDWVLQLALELTYQDSLIGGFSAATPTSGLPAVQAVFCIDVRSEVYRRALEATSASLHTRGFAGFFGLPISYTPAGSALTRPQLPGLLAPALDVTDAAPDASHRNSIEHRAEVLAERQRWDAFRRRPSSMFSFVEALGLFYAVKLVKESLPHRHRPRRWEFDGLDSSADDDLRPRLALVDNDPAAAAVLAHRVLSGMGLVEGFAPVVMLCGHGSLTANNPHAAGLDCGACGGQSGEVNARVLADLLNDPHVRSELRGLGVDVPVTTWFVAALHTTTTDSVELFDTDLAPDTHRIRISELEAWLQVASDRARAERATSLGLARLADAPRRLRRALEERANDWSQVRPEWGLADNAAFVVAPRWRTRHLDLRGRSFLHDYDWTRDPDLSVLTLIMTAPMVVTNWINMQYHASTVDNRRYGSGNKVLHNVVGGHLGVFEGNGGDLRIGLPLQSLHDGHTLRHHPLRLSVFIEAPRAMIDAVIDAQPVVQDLVFNGWLHLLRIESPNGAVEVRARDRWQSRPVISSQS